MNKPVIFVLGVIVGAGAGTLVTKIILDDKYAKMIDSEIKAVKEGIVKTVDKETKEAITTTPEDLKAYYIQGLKDLGFGVLEETEYDDYEDYEGDDGPDEYFTSSVNPVEEDDEDGDDEEEEEDEEDDDSDIAPIEPNPDPYVVTKTEAFSSGYEVSTLHYYKEDGVWTDTDYNFVDNWANCLGMAAKQVVNSDDESIYIMNETQEAVYEILIYNDSYKHAVEGED